MENMTRCIVYDTGLPKKGQACGEADLQHIQRDVCEGREIPTLHRVSGFDNPRLVRLPEDFAQVHDRYGLALNGC